MVLVRLLDIVLAISNGAFSDILAVDEFTTFVVSVRFDDSIEFEVRGDSQYGMELPKGGLVDKSDMVPSSSKDALSSMDSRN